MTNIVHITERSQVAEARRLVGTMAAALEFSETELGRIAIAATEIGTNLVKHAGGGSIIIRQIDRPEWLGLEILALDKGPGMSDLNECMRDGYSTGGSPGTGLGAIARMASQFDIYTLPGRGTALMARFSSPARHTSHSPGRTLSAEGVSIPMHGEVECGDAWDCNGENGRTRIMVADGLGHGPMAASAAIAATRAFQDNLERAPTAIIEAMHGRLRSTRGAAAAIADIDIDSGIVRYAGVGNIVAAVLLDDKTYRMVSHNGTLGHEMRKVQEFTYPWMPEALLVMHSDGLGTQWDMRNYPGLITRHLSIIAGVLYRDFSRGRDDTTVVVAREQERDEDL